MEQSTQENAHYKRCKDLLPLILDNQATSEDYDFFHTNAINWPDVMNCYQQEKAFREAIKSKLGFLPAPQDLMDSIKQSIVRV